MLFCRVWTLGGRISFAWPPHSLFHSAALNFRSLRFPLLIPFISQPVLHILSHPFPLPFYSTSFCFRSLLFIFFFQFRLAPTFCFSFPTSIFFSSPSSVSFSSCRNSHSCPLFFYHNHLTSSPATWLLTSFPLLFLYVRFSPFPFFPVLSLNPHHFPVVVPLIVTLFSYFPILLLSFPLCDIHISCFHILRIPSVFFP